MKYPRYSVIAALFALAAVLLFASLQPAFGQQVRETNNGGVAIKAAVITKTSSYTATENDHTILVNATSAAVTIRLPRTSKARVYVIKKIDSSANAVTIDPDGSQTIDGATSLVLSTQYDVAVLHADADTSAGQWFNLERRQDIVEARTATAAGTTTGTISPATTHVTVTSDDANKIIILPAPVVGKKLTIHDLRRRLRSMAALAARRSRPSRQTPPVTWNASQPRRGRGFSSMPTLTSRRLKWRPLRAVFLVVL